MDTYQFTKEGFQGFRGRVERSLLGFEGFFFLLGRVYWVYCFTNENEQSVSRQLNLQNTSLEEGSWQLHFPEALL